MQKDKKDALKLIDENLRMSSEEIHAWINRSFLLQPDELSLVNRPINNCLDIFWGQFDIVEVCKEIVYE